MPLGDTFVIEFFYLLPLITATRVSSGWRASISMRVDIDIFSERRAAPTSGIVRARWRAGKIEYVRRE
ncbi:hypothetical protein JCM17843_09050 [Kordiimonadales bacterium JCM 17843]|nr:hypothetical protein JCM17843_09050 [Kordiimonadales bacterium JCM 17843]